MPLLGALAKKRVIMKIEDIENEFYSGDRQRIEMMARKILSGSRSHEFMKYLSGYAIRFNELLQRTNPDDKDYLSLVYILAKHLTEIKNGKCACTIVNMDMFNSPSRLHGILEIVEEEFNEEEYSHSVVSKCISCGNIYDSKEVEWGFGRKVFWSLRKSS